MSSAFSEANSSTSAGESVGTPATETLEGRLEVRFLAVGGAEVGAGGVPVAWDGDGRAVLSWPCKQGTRATTRITASATATT